MKAYALGFGDTHTSHKLGLLNPDTTFTEETEDGEFVEVQVGLNPYQEYLWHDIYIPAIRMVSDITAGSKLFVFHGGDWSQGNKYTDQSSHTAEFNLVRAATGIMTPILQIPSFTSLRISAGTPAHDLTAHSATFLARDMLRLQYPDKDIAVNYQGEADILGLLLNYAHHGPGEGIRAYLNGNNVRYYLSDLMIRRLSRKQPIPDLVWRWHVHGNSDETFTLGDFKSRIMIIPSMCGMSFHARKATRSKDFVTNGMALVEITDGKITNTWKLYRTNELTTKEKLL